MNGIDEDLAKVGRKKATLKPEDTTAQTGGVLFQRMSSL